MDKTFRILSIITLIIVCVSAGVFLYSSFHQPTKKPMVRKSVPLIERTDPIGITKYNVTIIGTTNQAVLQDCVETGRDVSGFHIGELDVDGTPRYVLYCGYRPDLVGKTVIYKRKEGI